MKQPNQTSRQQKKPANSASSGNASNPGVADESMSQREKYLREAGNIEDMPDAQDQENADETIQRSKQDKATDR